MKEVVTTGETVLQAQEAACARLGVSLSQVKFEILQLPLKKTLGLFGGRPAKVRGIFHQTPAEAAVRYLDEILKKIGVKKFKIDPEESDGGVMLKVTGENTKLAIGRRGDTLEAIQYLTGLVANAMCDEYYRVTINVEDYRQRREKTLETLGRNVGIKAVKTQRNQELEPMSPYERRIIHLAVEQVRGARSWSEGDDLNRHIVVGPVPGSTGHNEHRGQLHQRDANVKSGTYTTRYSETK